MIGYVIMKGGDKCRIVYIIIESTLSGSIIGTLYIFIITALTSIKTIIEIFQYSSLVSTSFISTLLRITISYALPTSFAKYVSVILIDGAHDSTPIRVILSFTCTTESDPYKIMNQFNLKTTSLFDSVFYFWSLMRKVRYFWVGWPLNS